MRCAGYSCLIFQVFLALGEDCKKHQGGWNLFLWEVCWDSKGRKSFSSGFIFTATTLKLFALRFGHVLNVCLINTWGTAFVCTVLPEQTWILAMGKCEAGVCLSVFRKFLPATFCLAFFSLMWHIKEFWISWWGLVVSCDVMRYFFKPIKNGMGLTPAFYAIPGSGTSSLLSRTLLLFFIYYVYCSCI